MANIKPELDAILGATYGEEVRGSIHNAIEKINQVVENSDMVQTKADLEALEQYVDDQDNQLTYLIDGRVSKSQGAANAGKDLIVGDDGLVTLSNRYKYAFISHDAALTSSDDLNDLKTPGTWYYSSNANFPSNWPSGVTEPGRLLIFATSAGVISQTVQMVITRSSNDIWFRMGKSSSEWGSWSRIPNLSDITSHSMNVTIDTENETIVFSQN